METPSGHDQRDQTPIDLGREVQRGARARHDRLHEVLRTRVCLLDYAPGERIAILA